MSNLADAVFQVLSTRAQRKTMKECTELSALCPIEATVLGYFPNLGSSIFFAVVFGLVLIPALTLGIWKRTWSYMAGISIALVLELCGYIGRALLHKNPWDKNAFQMQICTIILAPTFVCVSIYLTLKHVTLALRPELSRFAPRWYPIIFLPADLSCLVVQAIGGGIAAAAGNKDKKLLDGGNNAIIAGVALQVVVLLWFGAMAADYYVRVRKYMRSPEADHDGGVSRALSVWRDPKFRRFAFAVTGAYACILIRCIYRIAEMAGGWGNHIMQDEPSFLVLDPTLVLIACLLLTIFHPGILFPQMCNGADRPDSVKESPNPDTTAESGNEEKKVMEGA